jgi:glycine dehydrogenase
MENQGLWRAPDRFVDRHIGPRQEDIRAMLAAVGCESLEALVGETVPAGIRLREPLRLGAGRSEHEVLAALRGLAEKNQLYRSFIGMGYHGCITPLVIQRNILENPGWYTQYTPYQAEIAQGRLEALINFQTMVADLTGLPLANASLLDEATAAAEAMTMCWRVSRSKSNRFFAAQDCHPQILSVLRTRARPLGIELVVGAPERCDLDGDAPFGILLSYPTTDGVVCDHAALCERAHAAGALVVVATDLLALTLLRPPGEFGADIAIGSSQRFGIPLGYGGPHAAFMATRDEHRRQMPGRIIGVSRDVHGDLAYRLALQTREQHIRRDRATSNICTAQVLLAVMAGMYAVYHGPDGLRRIARRVRALTLALARGLKRQGHDVGDGEFFDTLRIRLDPATSSRVQEAARARRINLRTYGGGDLGVSLDETTTSADVADLLDCFDPARGGAGEGGRGAALVQEISAALSDAELTPSAAFARTSPFLVHAVFHRYHSEHDLLRYIHRLQSRDLSLTTSMIPLGSCTMKLNATAEMVPVTWPEFAALHPFVPVEQAAGYAELVGELERWLAEITGLPAVSLQPNAGSQGEYAGLLAIRAYHESRGQGARDVCLIPTSAHGTNPASAVMAGYRVVAVACDRRGNVELADLRAKTAKHGAELAALMITYPSTHGVFEADIAEICQTVHEAGGQVYMDGANMNAQVGLCRPGDFGADVVHLNLHKTFCIPHGGGGPGMGPIAVASHLARFLPGDPLAAEAQRPSGGVGPVSAAAYGSASILTIPWVYIAMMGGDGLRRATEIAILNANYMAHRLAGHYEILYRGERGRVAHEFIIDARPFKKSAGIEVDDIAKRLMDYGFHAPTMSFPVAGTLMIEPTESESKEELDRLCDALVAIRGEIRDIEEGRVSREDNPLVHAPHTARALCSDGWNHGYSRDQAAFPAPWVRTHKFWPHVGRIDNAWGDRNLFCTCPSMEELGTGG